MDSAQVRRGFWFALGVAIALMFGVVVDAHASGVVSHTSSVTYWRTNGWDYSEVAQGTGESGDAAAERSCAAGAAANGRSYEMVDTRTCRVCAASGACNGGGSGTFTVAVNRVETAGCPSNSTEVGGNCTCNTNFAPNTAATACEAVNNCPPAGTEIAGAGTYSIESTSNAVCLDGCKARGQMAGGNPDGTGWIWGPLISTHETCTPSTGTPGPAPVTPNPPMTPDPLKPGQCPGTVNGNPVLVPCGTTQSSTGGTTGTTSTPAGGGTPTAGPTGTTESTTTCTGIKCTTTTTTTTTNPDGSSETTTTTDDKPKDSFCKDNPTLSICKTSSIGGSCAAVTCDGDAIQCAIAKEQAKRNCEVWNNAPGDHPANVAAGAGIHPSDHPYMTGTTTSMAGGFDQTNIISGSCPSDLTIPLGGTHAPVVIAFSKVCTPATWLGNLLVGLTAFACLGIVFLRGNG